MGNFRLVWLQIVFVVSSFASTKAAQPSQHGTTAALPPAVQHRQQLITNPSRNHHNIRIFHYAHEIVEQSTNGSGGGEPLLSWQQRHIRKRTAHDEAFSRNISQVLENLLQSYEKSQLPTHGKGVPTLVRTNMLIRSMGPVSELDMDYSMDCYFRQYWRDERLSFRAPIKSLSLSIKMLERIWRPDTYFYNGKNSHIHTITVPNKLLRLGQDGDILYSMRLTVKATCPMELKSFPMDRQSCPLILGSYAYTAHQLLYEWQTEDAVSFVPGMALSQFDLISYPQRNYTYTRREGDFSVLQVSFNLQRHTGYFLIQVYVPCTLIVVLSWVSFWIHREATSDRVGLGITTVLTLSTISLDSRTDLPKVKYATALDWFLLLSFFYCIATLLEFAGVHYFTKVGSGEIPIDEDEWNEWEDINGQTTVEIAGVQTTIVKTYNSTAVSSPDTTNGAAAAAIVRRRSSIICPVYCARDAATAAAVATGATGAPATMAPNTSAVGHTFRSSTATSTMERMTQTDQVRAPKWKQLWLCVLGDDKFRRQREREATEGSNRHINSVSLIDRIARLCFPLSFACFNLLYWFAYVTCQDDFVWNPSQ